MRNMEVARGIHSSRKRPVMSKSFEIVPVDIINYLTSALLGTLFFGVYNCFRVVGGSYGASIPVIFRIPPCEALL